MTFEMIDGNKRTTQTIRERLGVQDAHQQRACEAWALGDGYGIQILEGDAGLVYGRTNHRDEVSEMFARGEFGDDAAIRGM